MNREIKFRAWNKCTKQWAKIGGCGQLTDNICCFGHGCGKFWLTVGEHQDWIWSQYTGLKDKNGVELCEKDCWRYTDDRKIRPIQVLNSIDDLFFSDNLYYPLATGDFEIIGNVFENPELLEATE